MAFGGEEAEIVSEWPFEAQLLFFGAMGEIFLSALTPLLKDSIE